VNRPDWQQLLQQGIEEVRAQRGTAALHTLQEALRLQPGSGECRHWLGQALRLCGRLEQAESTFRSLLAEQPSDIETVIALAFLLREQGRNRELGEVLTRFSSLPEAKATDLLRIAGLLRDSNRFNDAISVMQSVIRRDGGQAVDYFRLARLLQGTGQTEAALQAYRNALERDASLGGAWLGLATLQRFTSEDQADWQLLAHAPPAANAESAMCLAFARAKGFDDLQQYAQAWSQYQEGNRLRRLSQPWDRAAWQAFRDQVMVMDIPQPSGITLHRQPVFIVGMLRSGTTLLEQLLDQHPQVCARGELNFLAHAWKLWQQNPASPAVMHELAERLWTHLRQDGPEDLRYIDKNPLNFRFLSLLAALLPEARILHLRRDGRDSCLSCYMQLFQHPDSAFSNDLDDLAQVYGDYLSLMKRFDQQAGKPILTVSYEELVSDSEVVMGRVLQFLGLAEPAAGSGHPHQPPKEQRPIRTASSWQARQDIHRRSLNRWRNYYPFAPDFFDRIAALDQPFKP
jgi:tetratricopeptide (TPR) repeat protein